MAVYQRLAQTLESEIRSSFSNGDFLPSEAELSQRFAVNRHTLRRAVDELVRAGLVLRHHGKGTMVVDSKVEYSIGSRARFTESLAQQGLLSSCRLLSALQFKADTELAQKMMVAPGTLVTQLDTLRCIEDEPVCQISHYLVSNLTPNIASDFSGGSLHEFIEQKYDIRISRQQCLVGAKLPSRAVASTLQCPRHLPLVVVKSNNVIAGSQTIIEYSVSRSRSDIFEYKIGPH